MSEWKEKAACKGLLTLFYSDDRDDQSKAKKVCAECSVYFPCLDEALAQSAAGDFGVRAGTTALERKQIRRKRGI